MNINPINNSINLRQKDIQFLTCILGKLSIKDPILNLKLRDIYVLLGSSSFENEDFDLTPEYHKISKKLISNKLKVTY